MRKLIFKIFFALIFLFGLLACKKGENDPFLSLKSRKARLSKEWVMTGMINKNISQNSMTTSNSTITYSNEILTETGTTTNASGAAGSFVGSARYFHTLTFNKNGTYNIHLEIFYLSGNKQRFYEEIGNWSFVGKSKNMDLKSKEAVHLIVTSTNTTIYENSPQNPITYVSYSSGVRYYGDIMYLDRLTNKELTIMSTSTNTISENGVSSENTKIINETFEAK